MFHLEPFVPPVTDCSTHLVHELLLAKDVFHLLLQLLGTTYLTLIDLLKLLKTFVPDSGHIYRHCIIDICYPAADSLISTGTK